MKGLLVILLSALLLFGCTAPASPEPSQAPGRASWSGWAKAHVYGGGVEKNYDITLTTQDDLYFDEAENAFIILNEKMNCQYSEGGHLPAMVEGMPETDMQRTGSGEYYKEYYETADEDKPRRASLGVNALSLNLMERETDWVDFSVMVSLGESDSWSEEGGCMIDDLYDVGFTEGEFELPAVDAQGREAVKGRKTVTYGSANIDVEFEYHKVEP